MNYRKLIEKLLSQKSNQNNTQVAVALVAGLAAGAVISILLAPNKGSNTRRDITDGAKGIATRLRDTYTSFKDRIFGHPDLQEPTAPPEMPHFIHHVDKKRKSDIKDLISEAHLDGHHTP